MNKNNLIQLIKENGKKIELNEGEYLFNSQEEDYNLYYIEKGDLILEKNGISIINIGEGEIIGEKSFIENQPKAIDGKVDNDLLAYKLDYDILSNISIESEKDMYLQLSLFLSDRVYKLNEILTNLSKIDNYVINFEYSNINDTINQIFKDFIDINDYVIFSYEEGSYRKIEGTIQFDENVESFINDFINSSKTEKIGKNYIIFKTLKYIYLLSGEVKIEQYILSNSLLYSLALFNNLAEKIEEHNNKLILEDIN